MKVFVSHHNSDKSELSKVKSFLQDYGFQLFLAHENIDVGEDYIIKIQAEIRNSDVFLFIANQASKESPFCNQEFGLALALIYYNIVEDYKIIFAYTDDKYLPQNWGLLGTKHGLHYEEWEDLKHKLLEEFESLKQKKRSFALSDKHPKSDLAIMNLLGSWDGSSQQDKTIVKKLLDNKDFSRWIETIRELINESQSPITLENSTIWKIKKEARHRLWERIGDNIFKDNLDKFKECAIQVLSEPNPRLEMSVVEIFKANFQKKIPNYSEHLREGIAQTLTLLGNKPKFSKHCKTNEVQLIPRIVVREVFRNADWVRWASLIDVLPLLAEAAPNEFIDNIEKILEKTPCIFDDLFFSQEKAGIWGPDYISSILSALEVLAWKEEDLARVTTLIGKLASRDPGGSWTNRADTSLFTIFLPLFPQTMASWEKRKVAIKILRKENSEVAWKLLLSFFPNSRKLSSGSHKPWSYTVSDPDPNEIYRSKEYKEQVLFYQETVIEMAMENDHNLIELIGYLHRLHPDYFVKLTNYIESLEMPQERKTILRGRLVDFIYKYRRSFAKDNRALPTKSVEQIEKIIDKLTPDDLFVRHSRLFNKEDYDLYEKDENYDEQTKEIESRRQNAIKEIFHEGGIEYVIEFVKKVKKTYYVGFSLGLFIDNKEDFLILKQYLQPGSDNIAQFIAGFIRAKHSKIGWEWVDKLNTKEWTETQKTIFLKCLPFRKETWERAEKWLNNSRKYWEEAFVEAPHLQKRELEISVTKLLQYDRPISAIECLFWMSYNKLQLPADESIRALLMAVSTKERYLGSYMEILPYNIAQIIKNLQNNHKVNKDDLIKVEFTYLDILDQESEYSPKTLEQTIASEPDFFHYILSQLYKSKNDENTTELTEEQENIATKCFSILEKWKTIPGTETDGTFSSDKFKSWIEKALKLCAESGRLEVGQQHIGKVLINSPEDPDDLWIHKTVAETLNKVNTKIMREWFSIALFYPREFIRGDQSDKALAEKYIKKAESVANKGFQRLGPTIRQLAEQEEQDAQWNIDNA